MVELKVPKTIVRGEPTVIWLVATNPDGTVGKGKVSFSSDIGSFIKVQEQLDVFGSASATYVCDVDLDDRCILVSVNFAATWTHADVVVKEELELPLADFWDVENGGAGGSGGNTGTVMLGGPMGNGGKAWARYTNALYASGSDGGVVMSGTQLCEKPSYTVTPMVTIHPDGLAFHVASPTERRRWSLTFTPPVGAPLREGRYVKTEREASANAPGMNVTADNVCNDPTGTFEVIELGPAASLYQRHAIITFDQVCRPESQNGRVRGWVRFDP